MTEVKRVRGPFSATFIAGLAAAAVVGVLAAVALDTWTGFDAAMPLTANLVAGVLGLPVSGVAAALAVDFVLKHQRRRDWGSVHAHVLTDVLPRATALIDAVGRCRPGEEATIRELGGRVVSGLQRLGDCAGRGGVRAADLPEELKADIDRAVALLGEVDARAVLESYDELSTAFDDLDLLDDPGVKLAVLGLRRSTAVFRSRAQRLGRHHLWALRELGSGRGRWDGESVHHATGSTALTVDGAGTFFTQAAAASVAAADLDRKAWELALAVQEAVA